MNDQSVMSNPEPGPHGTWLDTYMPGQNAVAQPRGPELVNVNVIRGLLYRQRWLVAAVLFAAAVVGVTVTLLMTPMYEATSKVSVKPFGEQVVEGQGTAGISSNLVYEYIATMVARIKSRQLGEVVVTNLKLDERQDLIGKDIDKSRPPGMSEEQFVEIVMRALPTGNVVKVRQYAAKIKPAERKKFVMSRPDTMKAYADIVAERNHKDTDADLGELFED